MRDSIVSSAVNCMAALCEFMIEKRKIKQAKPEEKEEVKPEEQEEQKQDPHSSDGDNNMEEQELEQYEEEHL